MQSQPEKNWLSLKNEFACVSRAFKDAGRNCKRIKSDTGMYFDPFSGAATDERNLERKPFRSVVFPHWSVFVAEWASISAEHQFC